MRWPKQKLSKLILPVTNWNPQASSGDSFDYIDISSVDSGQKKITSAKTVPCLSAPSRARQLVKAGDVLVSTVRPNLNCVASIGHDLDGATASTGFCVLRCDQLLLEPKYLFHWVQTKSFIADMVSKATGASYPAVSDAIIHASEIPLPPLEEQRRIAAILDKADRLLLLSRSSIAKLHQTLEACFGDLSESISEECVSKKLEEVVEAIIDYRGKSPKKTTEGIPLVTARLIKEGRILDATEFIAPESYSEWMRRGMPKQGDVVFTTEAPLGQVAQIANPNVALAQRLVLLRGKTQELDNTYLRFALQMKSASDQIRKRATGSTVMGIRQKELRKVEIPLPALATQKDFARLALAIEREIQHLRQRADFLTSLKRSLAIQLIAK